MRLPPHQVGSDRAPERIAVCSPLERFAPHRNTTVGFRTEVHCPKKRRARDHSLSVTFSAAAPSSRRDRKKSLMSKAHSSARTPPWTSRSWKACLLAGRSTQPPHAPRFGLGAPNTTRSTRNNCWKAGSQVHDDNGCGEREGLCCLHGVTASSAAGKMSVLGSFISDEKRMPGRLASR